MTNTTQDFNRFAAMLLACVIGIFGMATGYSLAMSQWAREDSKVVSEDYRLLMVYVKNLHAELKAEGFEPPPLPIEDKDK